MQIAIKSRTTQAKVWGSIISISGAFIVTFYKGKSIIIAHNSPSIHLQQSNSILTSIDTNWAIGGLLLTISNILLTIWFIAQGIFGKFLSSAVYAWAIHLKGPVYATMFKPLSIVIAVAMGILFLGDTLHIGSIIGGTVISIGFYTVMWGKAKEEEEDGFASQESSQTIENDPLLKGYKTRKF